ncbi:MAG: VCBS repeat-containing protein [Planctomycetota bacterium]
MKSTGLALCAAAVIALGSAIRAEDKFVLQTFEKKVVSELFFAEGAAIGDFNHDGKMDIVSGPFWYEGPDFKTKHQYFEDKDSKPFDKEKYSLNFFEFTYDINGDGWDDIIIYGFPGKDATWYENPKGKEGPWVKHIMADNVDNESPTFLDITGDGKPDIICSSGGFLGYFTADWKAPENKWTFHKISPKGGWQKFTHGLGIGDVNGDGKTDLLEANGWWEQPADLSKDEVWKFHATKFGGGGAQMIVYDVNGDGVNDVVTSLQAHGYGLAWFEGKKDDKGEMTFTQHLIMGAKPEENKFGLKFSQMHAVDMVDMDGDGIKDIVTGKRHWAHGSHGDPEPQAPAVLYWFKTVRNADKSVDFIPYKIDDDSGVGTELMVGDLNGDKLPDIVIGNKRGTFAFIHGTKTVTKEEWDAAQPKPVSK